MIVGHVKCGQAPNALKLSQQMQHERVQPDLVIFVGMLNACTSAEDFQCMDLLRKCFDVLNWCEDGVEIDKVTFVALLSTSGHSGFVDEGLLYVESIGSVYNISAIVEPYACMADLLGHAGCLHKAAE
ncbi:unnamed protein product [Sphagnum tenellum]